MAVGAHGRSGVNAQAVTGHRKGTLDAHWLGRLGVVEVAHAHSTVPVGPSVQVNTLVPIGTKAWQINRKETTVEVWSS